MARPKGSLNQRTLDLHAKCEAAGVDPFQILLDLCLSEDEKIKLSAAEDVCGYLYAKKRSVEVSADFDPELIETAKMIAGLPKDELLKIIAAELKKLK